MTSSSPAPKLPLWIFFVTDAALIGAAFFIGAQAPRPWSETTIVAVMACVIVGAFILFVPVIAQYERVKNEMLDDRQRALEALARTVGASAEQISIATGSLNEIAELSQKNLKHAEQLPHKLQEKIADFQAQLANASDSEKEELEKELEELRSSETERLQSISDRIAKTVAELAKLEAASQQHLTAANEAVTKVGFSSAGAIGKAQAAAEQAFTQARHDANRVLAESTIQAVKAIESAKTAALGDFTAQLNAGIERLREAGTALTKTVEQLQAAAAQPLPARSTESAVTAPTFSPVETTATAPTGSPESPAPIAAPAPATEVPSESPVATEPHHPETAPTPKRQRKPRREEPAPAAAPAEPSTTDATPITSTDASSAPATTSQPEAAPESSPAPVTPAATEPPAPSPTAHAAAVEPAGTENSPATAPVEKPARKRPARKAEDDQPGLGLELEEPAPHDGDNGDGSSAVVERVLTSDGATRLIVTAYIGIGNRLFIRGEGPGLSWDKGVPLQFVSIGKWRWESMDATGPVQVKLLKNDEQECSGLGALTIEPGHQHEVTANF